MIDYDKWINNYIDGVNIDDIEWLCLNIDELNNFYDDNYLDRDIWKYVVDQNKNSFYCSPIGLRYLKIDNNDINCKFLIGVVNNNINKKTIVGVMIYIDSYYMFDEQLEPLTYISSVEVNSYFWNRGIFKKICEECIKVINLDQNIILSNESEMGRIRNVSKIFREILIKNGFRMGIIEDNYVNYMQILDLVGSKKRILIK